MDSPIPNLNQEGYVWYVGYGSNLCQERFYCYIKGGQYSLGGSPCRGCKNKALPAESKAYSLPHRLYFARSSPTWNEGGVAFLYLDIEKDPTKWTLGRMWKITSEQFEEIKDQEGRWYDHKISLGSNDGLPVWTITSSQILSLNRPSDNYLSTITIGLVETYKLKATEIYDYLCQKDGMDGVPRRNLMDIIDQHA